MSYTWPRSTYGRPTSIGPGSLVCGTSGRETRINYRLSLGNAGDARPIGGGLSELRVDYGPGYRVYLMRRSDVFVLLLCGGDKGSQDRDIRRARELAAVWKED